MFASKDYISLARVRASFDLQKMNPELRQKLISDSITEQYERQQRLLRACREDDEIVWLDQTGPMENPTYEAAVAAGCLKAVAETACFRLANAFRLFVFNQELFLSGQSGEVVPVSADISAPRRLLTRPLLKAGSWREDDRAWHFLHAEYLTVDAKSTLAQIEAAKVILASELNVGDAARVVLKELVSREHAVNALLPYDGFFLSMKLGDLTTSSTETLQAYLWPTADDQISAPKDEVRIGGETTLEFVFRCVLDAYPDGKLSATWEEVEATTGYSRRQICRALDQKQASWWASRAGQR